MRAVTGSTRTIWIVAVTAVVSLAAGIGLSRLIVSPAEAAANASAPPAGPITVPVEERELTNDVVIRGDAIYEDPVSITLETGDIGGPAVVTGQVPEVGTDIVAGSIILEVTGRPVILLTGELPVYRTLRAGVSGPDVVQLRAALAALGIDAGNATSNVYDASAAAAVRALYAKIGYPAPSVGEEAEGAVDMAREGVTAAQEQVAAAQRALATAGSPQARVEADAALATAQASLTAAKGELADAVALQQQCASETPPDADVCAGVNSAVRGAQVAVTEAQGAVQVATVARSLAYRPDTTELRAAVTSAQRALGDAQAALAEAQAAVLTPFPASEVVYLTTTPRRVDSVEVRRGSMIAGTPVMTVSGATLQIEGSADANDAELITEGSEVVITLPDGVEVTGTVASVGLAEAEEGEGGEGGSPADPNRRRIVVIPGELTEEQRWMLQGSNVRIRIPVGSTDGAVMAVPLAALSAGPGGESRVEVLDDGATTPRLVTVETGLAAKGYVEVTPIEGSLEIGDQVVVGLAGSTARDDGEEEPEGETEGDTDDTATEEPAEG